MPVLMGSVHSHTITKPPRAGVAVSRSELVEPGAATCVFRGMAGPYFKSLERTRYEHNILLFERSEFLIATSKKKKTDRLCVCVCMDVRLILVLVLGRQTVYGQNTVYLCLSKYIAFENTHTLNNNNPKQCACNNCNGL